MGLAGVACGPAPSGGGGSEPGQAQGGDDGATC